MHISSNRFEAMSFGSKKLINRVLPLALLCGLVSCSDNNNSGFQGYIEGEYLYLAAPRAGYLETLNMPRGSRVTSGQTVFEVGDEPDSEALQEAQSRTESAQQKLKNLQQPRRPSEIAALEANLAAALAQQRLSRIQLQQQEQLIDKHFVAQIKLDEARAAHEQASAEVNSIKKQIATFKSSLGRQTEIGAAAADLQASRAQIEQQRWLVEHKTVQAPADGEISETYYQAGEWVPAGAAVASLLPDTRRKLRFYVPETQLAGLQIGDQIEGHCDACTTAIRAQINFISAEAEYTPPVIYSRGSREKLVFRVEAITSAEQARQLRPGLPIDVSLAH